MFIRSDFLVSWFKFLRHKLGKFIFGRFCFVEEENSEAASWELVSDVWIETTKVIPPLTGRFQ